MRYRGATEREVMRKYPFIELEAQKSRNVQITKVIVDVQARDTEHYSFLLCVAGFE